MDRGGVALFAGSEAQKDGADGAEVRTVRTEGGPVTHHADLGWPITSAGRFQSTRAPQTLRAHEHGGWPRWPRQSARVPECQTPDGWLNGMT